MTMCRIQFSCAFSTQEGVVESHLEELAVTLIARELNCEQLRLGLSRDKFAEA